MNDREKLLKLHQKVLDLENKMIGVKEELAIQASKILGYEVVADICDGSEIEFRTIDEMGYPDANSTILLEDILSK